MGTRGCYGFRKNGVDKLTYNHWDSYPDCLGESVVEFCKSTSIAEMNEIFDRIIMVEEGSKPTKKQIVECIEFYDSGVSTGSVEDWYCLLRETQGNLNVYKNGLGYMIDSGEFIKDSLFCEYAYIINLDTNCLEFWVGFQDKPCEGNRYGTETSDNMGKYYPCKMVSYYALDTSKIIEDIVADMNYMANKDDDEDYEEQERDVTIDDFDEIAEVIKNGITSGFLDNGIEWKLEFNL